MSSKKAELGVLSGGWGSHRQLDDDKNEASHVISSVSREKERLSADRIDDHL